MAVVPNRILTLDTYLSKANTVREEFLTILISFTYKVYDYLR